MQKIIDVTSINKILIIQTAFLGDVALTLYLVEAIKQIFPKSEIYFITTPNAAPIVQLSNSIEEVIEFDKRNAHKGRKGINQIANKINSINIDCLIAPHRSYRTSLLANKINSSVKIGYDINSSSSLVYNYRVQYHPALHEIDRLISLLEPFDIDISDYKKENIYPNLIFSNEDIITLQSILFENDIKHDLNNSQDTTQKPIIAIAPGSVWQTKRWHTENYSQLISILQNNHCEPVLIGGKDDLEICNEIQKSTNCKSIVGKTNLGQSILFLKYASLTITNDSAPTHFSDLVGTPVATIFGPTSPIFGFAPFRENDIIIEKELLQCRPCAIHGSNQCPLNTHECMTSITPEFVFEKILPILESEKTI